jgi:hypothetical protein
MDNLFLPTNEIATEISVVFKYSPIGIVLHNSISKTPIMSDQILTKLYFADQIRRFTLAKTTDFSTFIGIIKEFYPRLVKDDRLPILKYEDEEGEFVTFSTELEWIEALKQDHKILRIRLEKRANKKKDEKHFEINSGDYVVDLSPESVTKFLQTGEICIENPSAHVNIVCDGCNASGFTGNRYNCQNCDDFDFCENCHKKSALSHCGGNHVFKCITKPTFHKVVTHIINDDKKISKKERKEEKEIRREIKKEEKEHKREEKKIEKQIKKEEKKIVKDDKKVEKKEIKHQVLIPKVQDLVVEKTQVVQPVDLVEKTQVQFKPIEVVPSAPKEEINERQEKYNIHYKILESMGFKNVSSSTKLLDKHNGNLQKVVDELLSQ